MSVRSGAAGRPGRWAADAGVSPTKATPASRRIAHVDVRRGRAPGDSMCDRDPDPRADVFSLSWVQGRISHQSRSMPRRTARGNGDELEEPPGRTAPASCHETAHSDNHARAFRRAGVIERLCVSRIARTSPAATPARQRGLASRASSMEPVDQRDAVAARQQSCAMMRRARNRDE